MKKKLFRSKKCMVYSLLFMLLITNIYMSQPKVKSLNSSQIKIAATTTLLADLVENLVGFDVEPIIEPGTCPAHYDSSPEDVTLIEDADIVFAHGFETSWLDDLLASLGKTDAKFSMMSVVGYIPWGVPGNARTFLDVIYNKLVATYPDYQD